MMGGGIDAATGRRETGEQDLFRSRLDQIIDMDHVRASFTSAWAKNGCKRYCRRAWRRRPEAER
jgi:hypothetical protein